MLYSSLVRAAKPFLNLYAKARQKFLPAAPPPILDEQDASTLEAAGSEEFRIATDMERIVREQLEQFQSRLASLEQQENQLQTEKKKLQQELLSIHDALLERDVDQHSAQDDGIATSFHYILEEDDEDRALDAIIHEDKDSPKESERQREEFVDEKSPSDEATIVPISSPEFEGMRQRSARNIAPVAVADEEELASLSSSNALLKQDEDSSDSEVSDEAEKRFWESISDLTSGRITKEKVDQVDNEMNKKVSESEDKEVDDVDAAELQRVTDDEAFLAQFEGVHDHRVRALVTFLGGELPAMLSEIHENAARFRFKVASLEEALLQLQSERAISADNLHHIQSMMDENNAQLHLMETARRRQAERASQQQQEERAEQDALLVGLPLST